MHAAVRLYAIWVHAFDLSDSSVGHKWAGAGAPANPSDNLGAPASAAMPGASAGASGARHEAADWGDGAVRAPAQRFRHELTHWLRTCHNGMDGVGAAA